MAISIADVPERANVSISTVSRDTRIAKLMRSALTTVHVPMSDLGAAAIELLSKRLQDPKRARTRITLQSELVIRESCGLAT